MKDVTPQQPTAIPAAPRYRPTPLLCRIRVVGLLPSSRYRTLARWCLALLFAVLWCGGMRARALAPVSSLRALIVGGGPNKEYNQVAIESNVRYVNHLLPPNIRRTTLFADGNVKRATVLYEADTHSLPPARYLLAVLLSEDSDDEGHLLYRAPNLGANLDGPAQMPAIDGAFKGLTHQTPPPDELLLYFTGHGGPDEADHENNSFGLWKETPPDASLSVRELAQQIARLPANVPVTLVMVQCFSGSFGNLIFEGGDPRGEMVERDIAGFFAATKDRMAAGCTSAVNEAEYHDFTSYFFAALTGRDRMGRAVNGADYNHDGRVSMDEAYCYTLANDQSIDVPVCTSDVFLRRFVTTPDTKIFETPYSDVQKWGTPAQRAALTALSQKLHLKGEGQVNEAFRNLKDTSTLADMNNPQQRARYRQNMQTYQAFEALRRRGYRTLTRRFPALKSPHAAAYPAAEKKALAQLTRQIKAGQWRELLQATQTLGQSTDAMEAQEAAESYLLRFVRLCKSIVLAHDLRESHDAALQDRFTHLLALESQSPLPPATKLQTS